MLHIQDLSQFLLWCTALNYTVLMVWFLAFMLAHDGLYSLHTLWFKISREQFDAVHYASMALYKIGVLLLNLVPYLALQALMRQPT